MNLRAFILCVRNVSQRRTILSSFDLKCSEYRVNECPLESMRYSFIPSNDIGLFCLPTNSDLFFLRCIVGGSEINKIDMLEKKNASNRESQEFKAKKIHKIIMLAHKFTERNIVIYPMSFGVIRERIVRCSSEYNQQKKEPEERKET